MHKICTYFFIALFFNLQAMDASSCAKASEDKPAPASENAAASITTPCPVQILGRVNGKYMWGTQEEIKQATIKTLEEAGQHFYDPELSGVQNILSEFPTIERPAHDTNAEIKNGKMPAAIAQQSAQQIDKRMETRVDSFGAVRLIPHNDLGFTLRLHKALATDSKKYSQH